MNLRRGNMLRAALVTALVVGAVLWLPPGFAAAVVAVSMLAALLTADEGAEARQAPPRGEVQPGWEELSHLIEPLAEGVLLLDARRTVVAANPAAARILGRPPGVMVGSSLIVALRDHDIAEVVRAASGEAVRVHVSSSGQDVLATATHVEAGPVRTLLVLEDVTELERARRARADLVANLSHELRTPVAAARALAETLQAGVSEPEQAQRFHDRLVAEIGRLGEMVERLLRLSRLESGSETLMEETLAPGELARTAAERIEPIASAKGLRVEWAAGELPSVRGDRERVLEVLTNLLDNAVRYSPEGGVVRVRALAHEPVGRTASVQFEVSDEGPGILPEERARVFERFYTGDRSRRAGGGTGLGLAIARHIVQRLGGEIWVADRTPGATLCFTLPVAASTAAGDGRAPGGAAGAEER